MRCPRHTEQPVPCRHKVSCVTLLGAGVDGTSTRPLLAEGPPSTSNVKLVSRHSVGSFLSVETGVSESRTGYGHPYSLPLRLRPSLLVTGYGHPYSLPLRPSLLVTAEALAFPLATQAGEDRYLLAWRQEGCTNTHILSSPVPTRAHLLWRAGRYCCKHWRIGYHK